MKTKTWVARILLADLCWIALAFAATVILRYGFVWTPDERASIESLLPFGLASCIVWLFFSIGMKLDGFRGGWHFPAVVSRVFIAVGALMCTLLTGGYLFHKFVSRLALGYFGFSVLLGFICLRYATRLWLQFRYRQGQISRLVVVGSGRVAQELAVKIARHPEMLCKVVGFLCPQDSMIEDPRATSATRSCPVNLSTFGIVEHLQAQKVDQLIFALSRPVWPEMLNLIAKCREHGINVGLVPQPYELYLSKPEVIDLDGLPVLQLGEHFASPLSLYRKRSIDLVLGALIGLVALPVVLFSVLILKWTKGRALVWETRCGQYGKTFRMLRLNVDRAVPHASLFEHLLERLSITELPQFWNVMRGEMSLVGPRPETQDRVKRYSDWQQERLSVKPGMTGLAQVHGLREQNSSEEKARFDLQYRLNSSLFADLSLLLQTMWTLAMRVIRYTRLKRATSEVLLPAEVQESKPDLTEVFSSAHSTQSSTD